MKPTVKRGYRFALVPISIVGIAVTLSSGAMTTQAFGSGWSLKSSLTERVEYSDNINQSSTGAKSAYGSITSLGAFLGWQGRRQSFGVDSSFDFRRFDGPGSTPEMDTFNHSHKFKYSVKRKTTRYNYSLSHSIKDATTSELEDTGFFTRIDNNRITSAATASIDHDVNSRLKLNLSGSATYVDFEKISVNVRPYRRFNLKGSVIQKLSERTTGTLSIGTGFYNSDDLFNSESLTYRFTGKLATKFSHRLSAHFQAGVVLTEENRDATLTSLASSKDTVSGLFNLGLNYKLKRTKFSLSASHNLTPSGTGVGGLRATTRVGLNVSHKVNQLSNINFSISTSQSDTGTSLSVSPSYSYKFAKQWNANLGYSYRHQDSNGVNTNSNKVFFSVTRSFTHLP